MFKCDSIDVEAALMQHLYSIHMKLFMRNKIKSF